MKKLSRLFLSLILSLLLITPAFAVDEWGVAEPIGTRDASDIDAYVAANNAALDRYFAYGRHGCKLSYASASTVTVAAGSIVCSNSVGTVRRFRANSTATTVSWSDIDTGAEAASTTYYLWAVADADTATFTVKISTSSTAPTGITYYKRLGSFYNDASSNITQITDDSDNDVAYLKGQGNFYKLDSGTASVASDTQTAVSFSVTFAAAPVVVCTYQYATWLGGAGIIQIIGDTTTTGFNVRHNAAATVTLHWYALSQVLAQ